MLTWTASPEAGIHHHDDGVAGGGDLDLHLSDADGLDEDERPPRCVEQTDCLGNGGCQATDVAARRHRADEDGVVKSVILHTDPVAEDRPSCHWRGGVDREHGNRAVEAPADVAEHGVHQSRLPGARCAREAYGVGVPGSPEGQRGKLARLITTSLDDGEQAGEGTAVA